MAKKVSTGMVEKGDVFMGVDLGFEDPSIGFVVGVQRPDGSYEVIGEPTWQYAKSDAETTARLYKEHAEREKIARERRVWSTALRLDFMIGRTTGAEQKKWMRAKRRMLLGSETVAPWPKLRMPTITL